MQYEFNKIKDIDGNDSYGTVNVRIRTSAKQRRISTGYTMKRSEWDRYVNGHYQSNDILASINITYGLFANTLEMIKTEINKSNEKTEPKEVIARMKSLAVELQQEKDRQNNYDANIYVVDYIKDYIEDHRLGKRLKHGAIKKVSESALRNLGTLMKNISNFETDCETRLKLEDMTMDFQREYTSWNLDRGVYPNGITSFLKDLHTVLNVAYEEKKMKCRDFMNPSFIPRKEEVDNISLTQKQVEQMFMLDLSSKESVKNLVINAHFDPQREKSELKAASEQPHVEMLEKVRDIFVVGCLTGQRYSDYCRINTDMFVKLKGIEFIKLIQKKTGKLIYIPLDKRVKKIVSKYGDALPHVGMCRVNKSLRLIAELLGWTWKAEIDTEHMGRKIGERFCDMISTHTARRTFATNAYNAGVPIASIQAVTGHASEEQLRIYLKINKKENAVKAAHDFNNIMNVTMP